MTKSTLVTVALMVGAASLSQAAPKAANADSAAVPQQAAAADAADAGFSLGSWAANALTLFDAERDKAENPYIQEFKLKFRAQWQVSALDPAGGTDRLKGAAYGRDRAWNNEWRRFRIGAEAKVFNRFTLFANFNIGGLDGRETFDATTGDWSSSRTEGVLDELFIQGKFDPVTVTLGKHKPAFIGEYRTSSSKIITIERSALVNQLTAEKTWGLSVKNADSKARLGWEAGLWLNGYHDGTWAEPAFTAADNAMLGLSLNYALNDNNRLYLDYMHSFVREGRETIGYAGPGARDVVALTWEAKQGDLRVMTEAMAGFNVLGADGRNAGAENVYGLTVMPSYRLSDHFEAVVRYQLAAGSNGIESDKRYYATNSAFSQTCDLLHGFYLGVNYYVCPSNPHAMKVMCGAEYLNSHGTDARGDKGFTGWSFTTAFRVNF